ncbi:FHA domain-containing protein [Kitasatospora azatica]|uniref:FHA domain-containing protein n=1 Tax=Kitasatospora azatica TaxID=58347 RepID=UPI00056099A6|nr:FHA domain-containing protein [Kitasatospora azatica]
MPICPSGHESQSDDYCDYCGLAMRPTAGVGAAGPFGAPGPFGGPVPPPPMSPPPMPPQAPPMPGGYPGMTEGLVTCPICRSPKTGRYCEECGYDYDLAAAAPQQPAQPMGYGYPPPAPAQPAQPAQGYGYPQPDPYQPVQQTPPPPSVEQYGTSFHLAPPSQPVHQQQPEPMRTTWVAVVNADRDYFTDMMARSGPEASGLFFPPYCPERRIPITGRGQLRIGRRSQHRGTVPEIDLSVPPEDPGASHQHALLAEQPDGSWVLVDQDSTNGTTMNGGAETVPPHTAIPLNDGDRIHIGAWTTITLHRA